ncbi:putative Seipin family protein [Helianthus debilis subsp. tardiflorus]
METLTISHRPLLPSLHRTSVRSGVSSTPRSVTLLHLSLPHSQMLCSISNRISLLVPAFLFGGMMMRWIVEELVRVDFLSSDGNVLASTRQPCMLWFKSQPIRHVSTFLKLASVLEKTCIIRHGNVLALIRIY